MRGQLNELDYINMMEYLRTVFSDHKISNELDWIFYNYKVVLLFQGAIASEQLAEETPSVQRPSSKEELLLFQTLLL